MIVLAEIDILTLITTTHSFPYARMLGEGLKGGPKVGLQRWAGVVIANAMNFTKARQPRAGKFSYGHGLRLVKRGATHGRWILCVSVDRRRCEVGVAAPGMRRSQWCGNGRLKCEGTSGTASTQSWCGRSLDSSLSAFP